VGFGFRRPKPHRLKPVLLKTRARRIAPEKCGFTVMQHCPATMHLLLSIGIRIFVGEMLAGISELEYPQQAFAANKGQLEKEIPTRNILLTIIVILWPAILMHAQENHERGVSSVPADPKSIELSVPAGHPLPVVLDKEVLIRKSGQEIHGKIAESVYVFDKMVVPAGSEVTGTIARIDAVSFLKRLFAAMNSDFSPVRDVDVTFTQLVLPDGHRIPLHTQVSPAPKEVLDFATAKEPKDEGKTKKHNAAVQLASQKVSEKKKEVNREWDIAKSQIKAPGKIHRLKRILISELPIHPQYIDAGTRFNAELLDPLNFGTENKPAEQLSMVGTVPAPGSIVHALLKTPLSSATVQKGEAIEAEMTEPLVTDNQLILPQGTLLKGAVLQVRPARRLHRNGQLRIIFREIVPPSSTEQKIEGNLEGVEAGSDANISLDSEGGAQATSPKTRYLTTGLTVALAAASFAPDRDAGANGLSGLEIAKQGATGASGFRVVGFAIGLLVHSRPLASAFGVYGAAKSIYSNFLSRGHEIEYSKDTAIAVGLGSRVSTTPKISPQN